MEPPDDRELSGRVAARVLRRRHATEAHPVRPRKPAFSQAPDGRRRDDRPGLAGTTQQSLREAARQSGGVPLDPCQQSVAADLSVGRQPRRGRRRLSRRPQLQMRRTMQTTKRKPATVGEILVEEFMQPMGLTQAALAEAMGVQRKHVNELCNNRRNVTAATALILARVFGNSPDFWLNVQRRSDLWEAMNSPRERERIERATPLVTAA